MNILFGRMEIIKVQFWVQMSTVWITRFFFIQCIIRSLIFAQHFISAVRKVKWNVGRGARDTFQYKGKLCVNTIFVNSCLSFAFIVCCRLCALDCVQCVLCSVYFDGCIVQCAVCHVVVAA